MREVTTPIEPDALLHNADWAKQSWDLPTDADAFIAWLDGRWAWFKELPAYASMPAALRQELERRGFPL